MLDAHTPQLSVMPAPPLLCHVLPAPIATAESRGDLSGRLAPIEEAVVARAVDARCREFRTGRVLARRALEALPLPVPVPVGAIPAGAGGEPVWPAGIVGSITHCPGFRGVAVARASDFAAVAVDAVVLGSIGAGVLEAVTDAAERDQPFSGDPRVLAAVLFSGKETVFKLVYALVGRRLRFEDARVHVLAETRFEARLRPAGIVPLVTGRWHAAEGLALTAAAIPTRHVGTR